MIKRTTGILVSLASVLLLLIPTVAAQTSTMIPGAITVLGEGSASAPAETATIVITIGSDSMDFYEEYPAVEATAAASDSVDVQPIVDALIAYGIPVNDIQIVQTPFTGEWGKGMTPPPTTIVVKVSQPEIEVLSELLAVTRTAASENELYVNQFGVIYEVADCRAILKEARADAFANARVAAEDQAAAMGTTIGDPIASRDAYPINSGGVQTNNCTPIGSITPYSITYMAGAFDPGLPAEVTVWVSVEVSFQIP